MLKFFQFLGKHKKLTIGIGAGLVLLGAFSFLTSLKGQLMLAFLASAFLFAAVSVGGFVWLKSRPKSTVLFKVHVEYKEPRRKIFGHDAPTRLYAKITATTSQQEQSREVYEKVLEMERNPRPGEDLLAWFQEQIDGELQKGAHALQAQDPDIEIQTDESFRLELDGRQQHVPKPVDTQSGDG